LIAPRFTRRETLGSARDLMLGLVADLSRKNCWTLAEHSGHANPDRLHTDEEHERRIKMKMRRQHLITRRIKPTQLTVVLGETVLRRVIGDGSIMAAQLKHLADIGTRPNVSIRVLPFASGMPTGDLIGTFVILEFPEDSRGVPIEPTIVYAENYTGDMYSEKVGIVRRYWAAYERIRPVTLDEVGSRALLRNMAREYQRER
ncbi:DUF5753 domain-containing protein, partial [Nocardia wallacei]|uniref:DUF5753 domain-containing protein n=1 Tax=Nocardia wallacei TaxID=480035 RepID=UPI003CC7EE26